MPDLIVGGVIVVLSFAACIGYTGWLLYGALTDNPAVVSDEPGLAKAENEWDQRRLDARTSGASWGCRDCLTITPSTFLWLARWRSRRHQVRAHRRVSA